MYNANLLDVARRLFAEKDHRRARIAAMLQIGSLDEATEDLLRVISCAVPHQTLPVSEAKALYNLLEASPSQAGDFPQECGQLCFIFG